MKKTNSGRFFEDYSIGQVIDHAVPRTVKMGERALYHALYPARHALYSSDQFAQDCGLPFSPLDDMIAFHVIFGKTVPDVSLNAVANLGYAQGRWLMPVWPGDTLRSRSEVIGLKQNSNGKTGVLYVRTTGLNQHDETVMEYVRWVMVRKRDVDAPAPETVVPDLPKALGQLRPQLARVLVRSRGLIHLSKAFFRFRFAHFFQFRSEVRRGAEFEHDGEGVAHAAVFDLPKLVAKENAERGCPFLAPKSLKICKSL